MHHTLKYNLMTQPMFIMIYIIPSLLISPILTLSLNSWFSMWLSLEFNLMSFIPLIIFFNNKFKNLAMKYFIIQAFSSSIFIFSSNCMLMMMNNEYYNIITILMNLSILIKLGAAPFHTWFINMMNNLNWLNCLILSTWQKIIPLIMLIYLNNYKILYFSAFLSCMIATIFGLNHQSLRLILGYSSINHISWMLINSLINETLMKLYFISYMIISINLMTIFFKFNIFYINQIFYLNNFKFIKILLLMNFFSISGLPPMFGFIMKWLSLYFMNINNLMIINFIILMMSISTFYFYTRICFMLMIQFNLNIKLLLINKFLMPNSHNLKLKLFFMMNSFIHIWIISIWMMI